MAIRYKNYRIPIDVHKDIIQKQKNLEAHARNILKKKDVKIPKTNIMRMAFGRTWYGLQDSEIKDLVKRNKTKRKEINV